MQMNQEYDLSKPLGSALRAKAPYVGVPVPGHAPLILERDRLARALKGVTPVNIEIIVHPSGARSLLVEGRDGHVRTRMMMHSKPARFFQSLEGMRIMDAWHKAEVRKRCNVVAIPSGADRKTAAQIKKATETLRKLQKEFDGMRYPVTLHNPAVPGCSRYAEGQSREYAEQAWKSTRECKRLRTIVGAIAHQARRENWTTQRLYKELDSHHIEHTKLSGMTGKQRETQGAATVFDYNRNLYKFCRGTGNITGRGFHSLYSHDCGRPDSWAADELKRRLSDGQEWGPARYMVKLADMQERRALQSHMDSIKSLMARLRGETEDTGETQDQAAEVAA